MLEVRDTQTGIVLLFPSSWDEVTLKQFQQLRELPEDSVPGRLLAILVDAPDYLPQLSEPTADIEIFNALKFLRSIPDFQSMPRPGKVTIGGRTVVVPEWLGLETYGQKMAIDDLLRDLTEVGAKLSPITAAIPLLSVYLCEKPIVSLDQIKQLSEEIEKMSVTIALPLAGFFLKDWQNLTSSGRLSFRETRQPIRPKMWLKFWFLNWPVFRRMRKRRQ